MHYDTLIQKWVSRSETWIDHARMVYKISRFSIQSDLGICEARVHSHTVSAVNGHRNACMTHPMPSQPTILQNRADTVDPARGPIAPPGTRDTHVSRQTVAQQLWRTMIRA